MTRPPSHSSPALMCCATCRYARHIDGPNELLCFFNDPVRERRGRLYAAGEWLTPHDVEFLANVSYPEARQSRIVGPDDACDRWQLELTGPPIR